MIPDLNSPKQKRLDNVAKRTGALQAAQDAQLHAVRLARREGATWDEVGEALGTSRQGAHKRFSFLDDEAAR